MLREKERNNKMKKIVAMVIVLAMLVTLILVGCAAPAKESEAPATSGPVMTEWGLPLNPYEGFAVKKDGTPYLIAHAPFFLGVDFMVNAEGITKSLVTRAGANYITFDPGMDAQKQIAYVEDLITLKHPDAIIMMPVDENMLAPVCEKAMAAGIDVYVWGFDLMTDVGKGRWTTVCRNWEKNGSDLVGQYYVDYAEKTGQHLYIYELWGLRSQQLCIERHAGFRSVVDKCPLITVMESPDCQWSDEIAANLVTDAFTAHPELNALYCMGGGGTGAIQGLKTIGRLVPPGDPKHVLCAFNDCDTLTVQQLDAGTLDAFGAHQSWDLCDIVTKLAFWHTVLKQTIPGNVDAPMKVITHDNIDAKEGLIFGAPVYPRMPEGQWDKWPVLDTRKDVSPGLVGPNGESIGVDTPTKDIRKNLLGY
jgi:ABC-type sugar transport system substrate-binding protein